MESELKRKKKKQKVASSNPNIKLEDEKRKVVSRVQFQGAQMI